MNGMHGALSYLGRNWSILPLQPYSKLPATTTIRRTRGVSTWTTYRDRHATADELAAWDEIEPEHNVGILCGETSGNLAVVDVDAALPAEVRIPFTATVRTGRGKQFYAVAESSTPTTRLSWGEVRGEGSYVVAPQSIHPNGRQYEWEHEPTDGIAALDEFALPLVSRALAEVCSAKPTTYGLLGLLEKASDSMAVAPLFAAALGIEDFRGIGKPFRCVLHSEENPSATLFPRADNGRLLYHDFHLRSDQWLALPAVRAYLAGRYGRLSNSEFVTWSLRLEVEAGIRAPAVVSAGELPPDASPGLRVVWNGFLELFRARWLHTLGEPAPFSNRFGAHWCGCSRTTVERHFPELRRLGLAQYAGRDTRGTSLWLPGEGVRPLRPTR